MMKKILGQGLFYAVVAVALGYLSASPTYTHVQSDKAVIKVSFSHGAERKEPCHKRTREELMALPPNMRKPMDCKRQRLPVYVELILDGEKLIARDLPPMGIAKDGQSQIYHRMEVPTGAHSLQVGIRDTARTTGFDYEISRDITLVSRQNLVVDFKATRDSTSRMQGKNNDPCPPQRRNRYQQGT